MMRSFIVATAAVVSLFLSPALTQQPNQGSWTLPDFSGVWGHPYVPAFEAPESGPVPVVNKSRRRQVFAVDGDPIAPGADAPLTSNTQQFIGDYTNPILKSKAAESVKRFGDIELSGAAAPTPSSQCWPEPPPYIFWNLRIELLQQPDRTTILYSEDHEVRHVRMNQSHPARVVPSWYGDSIGHYEGDALVVDTIGIRADRPFAMVDMFGTPYTSALHVVERYRLIDYEAARQAQQRAEKELFHVPEAAPDPNYRDKGLQLSFTVEDSGAFTTPWSATVTYRRTLTADWLEIVCAENKHEYYGVRDTAVPSANNPDF
jgi:hypothetical protein